MAHLVRSSSAACSSALFSHDGLGGQDTESRAGDQRASRCRGIVMQYEETGKGYEVGCHVDVVTTHLHARAGDRSGGLGEAADGIDDQGGTLPGDLGGDVIC